MKKIISFSLWGDLPMYTIGAIENIKLAKEYFPEWICRFYVNDTVSDKIKEEIIANGGELIKIKSNVGGSSGMFWRFLANDDPEVEMFLSRDCDSRLNIREKNAIDEWLESGKALHTMHDHYAHIGPPIMGGMWGLRTGVVKDMAGKIKSWPLFLNKGCDQIFLHRIIWPLLKNDVLRHDNGHQMCFGSARKFPPHTPIKFGGTFVGEIFNENNNPVDPVAWDDVRMKHYDGELIQ
jgi:protein O-GlcNAc transferase